ncbi:MAG: alpha/beta fold hydrolase [Gemmatimonadaceae bacterium]
MRALIGLLLLLALLVAQREWVRRLLSAQRRRARPVGASGIVEGAESIELPGPRFGVLVLHGFGDTPQSVVTVARALHAAGLAVRVPLLPGHGRTLEAFSASRRDEWESAARHSYAELAKACDRVAIVGVSMGGTLACILAADDSLEKAPVTMVLITPYLYLPPVAHLFTAAWPIWSLWRPWVPSDRAASIQDPEARKQSLGYGMATPRLLRELRLTVEKALVAIDRLRVPTLAIFSEADYRIPVAAARTAYDRIASPVKELRWVSRSGHVVTVDYDRDEVAARTVEWIQRGFGQTDT